MGKMQEIKNKGQFDTFIWEVVNDLSQLIQKIGECDYIPEGMDEIFTSLVETRLMAELLLSKDELLKMY